MTKKLIVVLVLIIIAGMAMIGYGLSQRKEASVSSAGGTGAAGTSLEQKYVRYDEGQGGVQVTAVLLTPEYIRLTGMKLPGNYDLQKSILQKSILFEIAMTTHMGDLREYPIAEKAELLVNGKVIKPADWKLTADDGHHPVGLLIFSPKNAQGTPVLKSNTVIELNLKELQGVSERKFTWSLPL
ncbi:hypothetical protein [Thermincola ferriacetica]